MEVITMTEGNLSNIWCRFVLAENIVPSVLARSIKRDESLLHNTKLLAQILKEREQFNDSQYPELKESAMNAFQNDDELCVWLKNIEKILTVIINFSDADEDTIYILNGAFVSFIKACPLVLEQIKTQYLEELRKNTYTPPLNILNKDDFVSSLRQDKFVKYLKKKYHSEGTINSYKSAVNVTSKILNKNLWTINDYKELQQIMDDLIGKNSVQSPKNQEIREEFCNKNHKNVLYYGLKQYEGYLLSIANK